MSVSLHWGRWAALTALAGTLLAGHRTGHRAMDPAEHPSDPEVLAAPDPGRGVPLSLTLEGPAAITSNEFDVRVLVERRAPAPFRLRVRLPPTVELVSGLLNERINGSEPRVERTFRLRLSEGIPSQSLMVVARARGRAQGVRATAEYRFGGAEPTLERPERPGPRLRVQGHDLGSAIPLQ